MVRRDGLWQQVRRLFIYYHTLHLGRFAAPLSASFHQCTRAVRMLLALTTTTVALSPSTALDAWRSSRLVAWSNALDRRFDSEYTAFGKPRIDLRYRMQVLVVDRSGLRGRLCEAVLDKLCEDVDAAVDVMTSSIGPASALQRPGPAVCDATARLGLSRLPLEAGARRLRPDDLLASSRWDLVVCVDLEVLELVREMAREANAIAESSGKTSPAFERHPRSRAPSKQDRAQLRGPDGIGVTRTILCMTDFLASGVPPMESAR